ncbi:hypothetical protein ABZV31_29235 [Streptomyces sp. NPDC005202]|uniref:hypothetical protein n=1 Tax=Streptomyces sp. NPDC005202 TaxID=3157021 RepID=UPI0033A7E616
MIKILPDELRHEVDCIMAEGDMVMVRGRFSGHAQPAPWIAADFVRMEDGLLKEHWDIIENETSRANSLKAVYQSTVTRSPRSADRSSEHSPSM